MVDYEIGEKIFKEFISFRHRFLSGAIKQAQYTATSAAGDKYRPIVLVSRRDAKQINQEIEQWHQYAEQLESYPDLDAPKSLFYPEPRIIIGAINVTVYENSGSFTRTSSPAIILSALRSELKRAQARPDTEDYQDRLRREIAVFTALPLNEKLRVRYVGYTDTLCNITYPAISKVAVERVSANGLFLVNDSIKEFRQGAKRERNYVSIYDFLPFMTASCYEAKIYRVDDIERAKVMLVDYKNANMRDKVTKKATYTSEEAISFLSDAWKNEKATSEKTPD